MWSKGKVQRAEDGVCAPVTMRVAGQGDEERR